MGSLNDVWIPDLAVGHFVAILMVMYAVERMSGALTGLKLYIKWKCGCLPPKQAVKQPSARGRADALNTDTDQRVLVGQNGGPVEGLRDPDPEVGLADSATELPPSSAGVASHHLRPVQIELTWTDITYKVQPVKTQKGAERKSREILHRCSGQLLPRQAVAIMGPSGAGKSTMMDILTGRKPSSTASGNVRMNGHVISDSMTRRYLSYIAQEDAFLPVMTAWESLTFYSRLSMPSTFDTAARHERMNAVMETMGLQNVKQTMVGGSLPGGIIVRGLSGGEKRRLSVACGLVGNPSVVFLDEPTTGLDSHAALNIVMHLIELTRLGLTIACSIHQPRQEIFNAFDKVIILSEGYQVYFGSPSRCVRWFNEELGYHYYPQDDGTVSDWLITLVSIKFQKDQGHAGAPSQCRSMRSVSEIEQAARAFEQAAINDKRDINKLKAKYSTDSRSTYSMQSPEREETRNENQQPNRAKRKLLSHHNRDLIAEEAQAGGLPEGAVQARKPGPYSQSWFVQYGMLTQRAARTILRNTSESATRLLVGMYLGMIAGLVYIRLPDNATSSQPRTSTIFFAQMINAVSPMSYMAFYATDRHFFRLDSANGLYAPSAYYLAAVTAGTPFVILNTCAGSLMVYGLAGLRSDVSSIFIFMAIMSLHTLVSNNFLVTCIWLTPTQDTAYAIASTYLTFSLLFCGFYVAVHNMVLSFTRALTWASFSKYTFQALLVNEFQDRTWTEANPDRPDCGRRAPLLIGGAEPLCNTSGNAILEYFGTNMTIAQAAAALLGFYFFFHLTAFWALHRLYKAKAR